MSDTLQNLKAITFVIMGFALFSFNDVLIKVLAQTYTVPQTLFWTSVFVCLVLVFYGLVFEGRDSFKTGVIKAHFTRGFLMTLMVLCNIYALVRLQITDFYAIVFTGPLVISLLAWIFLKDRLEKCQVFTIFAGFAAVLFMCRPGGGLFNIGALAAFGGVIFFAFSTLLVRSQLREENPLLIGINGPVVMALVALPLMAWFGFTIPHTPTDWILFFLCGAAAGFGGVFFGMGFQYASSAAVVAPFHYTQMIWGAILGYFVFSEVPSQDVVIGSFVLAVLGIYLIIVEARIRKHTLIEKENLIQHGPV